MHVARQLVDRCFTRGQGVLSNKMFRRFWGSGWGGQSQGPTSGVLPNLWESPPQGQNYRVHYRADTYSIEPRSPVTFRFDSVLNYYTPGCLGRAQCFYPGVNSMGQLVPVPPPTQQDYSTLFIALRILKIVSQKAATRGTHAKTHASSCQLTHQTFHLLNKSIEKMQMWVFFPIRILRFKILSFSIAIYLLQLFYWCFPGVFWDKICMRPITQVRHSMSFHNSWQIWSMYEW